MTWIGIIIVLVLLYILVILFIKFGIDPNKQRRRILLKIEKLNYQESKPDDPAKFDNFLEHIDKMAPMRLSDPAPKHIKSGIIGFCHMCGAGRTRDANFCHFCGMKFDLDNLNEIISLHKVGGQKKFEW